MIALRVVVRSEPLTSVIIMTLGVFAGLFLSLPAGRQGGVELREVQVE
jgi:hypothetical protein